MWSANKLFLKVSQNSQENTCNRDLFRKNCRPRSRPTTLLIKDSIAGILLWVFGFFSEKLFYKEVEITVVAMHFRVVKNIASVSTAAAGIIISEKLTWSR